MGLLLDFSVAYFILWVYYHSISLFITADLLFELLWHSSFSRLVVHLVHFLLSPTKQDFWENWEFAFGLRGNCGHFKWGQVSHDSCAFSSNLTEKVTGRGKVLYRF